ncbi:MAG: hypothetical protein Q8P41_20775 [Pseudomonadota bacterium]|nr:hypothetical protein [Pseudomonadota bacterium]
MRIQGIRELPEPTFRTVDDAWVSLDSVVKRVCEALRGDVSPVVAKCTIQLARHAADQLERVEIGALASQVCYALRGERIVVTPIVVMAILMAYATEVAKLDVVQTEER